LDPKYQSDLQKHANLQSENVSPDSPWPETSEKKGNNLCMIDLEK